MDFIISSGLITLIAAIPVPLLAVPYAAPNARKSGKQIKTKRYLRAKLEIRPYLVMKKLIRLLRSLV